MEDRHQTGCADAHPRINRVGRRFAAIAAFAALGLAAAAPASASVTIGQVPANQPPNVSCPAGDYLQPSVTGGILYITKQAGNIVSWTTFSSGAGTYAFKVFRRTSDPDVFQVIAQASEQSLSTGLETFPVDIPVRSGDMIGFHKQGGANGSCAVGASGDALLQASSDLAAGESGPFGPLADRRLNLAANLVPSNDFQITHVSRNIRRGTATLTVYVSNPGVFTLSGKGLKRGHVARTLVGAGPITLEIAAAGGSKHKLLSKGSVRIGVNLTFVPTNGDPKTQPLGLKLRMKRNRAAA
jgi:hypothetical protein